jgi:hypothetical protein
MLNSIVSWTESIRRSPEGRKTKFWCKILNTSHHSNKGTILSQCQRLLQGIKQSKVLPQWQNIMKTRKMIKLNRENPKNRTKRHKTTSRTTYQFSLDLFSTFPHFSRFLRPNRAKLYLEPYFRPLNSLLPFYFRSFIAKTRQHSLRFNGSSQGRIIGNALNARAYRPTALSGPTVRWA